MVKFLKLLAAAVGGALALFVLVGIVAVVTSERTPAEESQAEVAPPQAPQSAPSDVASADPAAAPSLQVGALHFTAGGGYLVGASEAQMRQALDVVGDRGRLIGADAARWRRDLAGLGVGTLNGGDRVRPIEVSGDGRLVRVEVDGTEDALWTVPAAVVMPIRDIDGVGVLVGERYVLAMTTFTAPTPAALLAADDAISEATGELPYDDARAAVVRRTPGLALIPKGTGVGVIDLDASSGMAAQIRLNDSETEAWIFGSMLRRAER